MDCCSERLSNTKLQLLDQDKNVIVSKDIGRTNGVRNLEFNFDAIATFSVRVQHVGKSGSISLAEVEVFGHDTNQVSTRN